MSITEADGFSLPLHLLAWEEMLSSVQERGVNQLYPLRLREQDHLQAKVLWHLRGQSVLHPIQVKDHRSELRVSRWDWIFQENHVDQCLLLQSGLQESE